MLHLSAKAGERGRLQGPFSLPVTAAWGWWEVASPTRLLLPTPKHSHFNLLSILRSLSDFQRGCYCQNSDHMLTFFVPFGEPCRGSWGHLGAPQHGPKTSASIGLFSASAVSRLYLCFTSPKAFRSLPPAARKNTVLGSLRDSGVSTWAVHLPTRSPLLLRVLIHLSRHGAPACLWERDGSRCSCLHRALPLFRPRNVTFRSKARVLRSCQLTPCWGGIVRDRLKKGHGFPLRRRDVPCSPRGFQNRWYLEGKRQRSPWEALAPKQPLLQGWNLFRQGNPSL